jgi:glycosyltransferase involved in cell wall biosynthesis
MKGISIIICTHNPRRLIFERLIKALQNLNTGTIKNEVIIVDNNSKPALSDRNYVIDFIESIPFAIVKSEPNPGLTAARLAGIKIAKNDWLVFFDDDNEPEADYLNKVQELVCSYPKVGAWGPGSIDVEYLSDVSEWLQYNRAIFQQRNDSAIKFDLQQHWQPCYPYGTGMVIKKEIAEEYVTRVESKRYTMSDRKGKSLSSGGDVQMVLTGIDLGYAAGVAPELRLKHLIERDKTRFRYLLKLIYGTSSSYIKAYNQVFKNSTLNPSVQGNLFILKLCWYYYKQFRRENDGKTTLLSLTGKLGELNAGLLYNPKLRKPFGLKIFELVFL